MKNLFTLSLALLTSFSAFSARAENTADPAAAPAPQVRKLYGGTLSCASGRTYYGIGFDIYLVPVDGQSIEMTAGATVSISDAKGENRKQVYLHAGEFEYELGVGGMGGYFYSRKLKLRLDNCTSPVMGGVSIGN